MESVCTDIILCLYAPDHTITEYHYKIWKFSHKDIVYGHQFVHVLKSLFQENNVTVLIEVLHWHTGMLV